MMEIDIDAGEIVKNTLIDFTLDTVSWGIGTATKALAAKKEYSSIIGKSTENIDINRKLKDAGYGNLKIGKDGVVGVISEIMKKSKIADIVEKGVTTIIDCCFGFVG